MTPPAFRLEGLLRVRRVQEEQAVSVLADRRARLRDSDALRDRALQELAAFGEPGTDVDTLRAIAASRASSAARLGELQARRQALVPEVDAARAAHAEARRRVLGLERLEAEHARETIAETLRAEQLTIDELATTRAGGTER
jgi:flagellar FliJ protein